ncbi:helix-turn-helix transcriptional regulator [Intrasporangium sp.]|uniref:helix-turn-helix transcriptional regulator n=1 Tax=Intrasporangium sp. TaxID=1925024 RepID=UPI0029396073|nr:LuxR C-terminal-related transcriptional regulator [Intrasporangium sp.]MDV3223427.1 LuxR C-terminal-related transcriptional regulator [Intrasporangium sp.]
MLHGRRVECHLIDEMLAAADRGEAQVGVLHGGAGVGKTALLRYARERAGDMTVLEALGVEPESHLPFAGLHMLLRPVASSIRSIPAVQAEALRAALGATPAAQLTNRFLIGAALVSLLAEVADHQAVLCLVDDAQWLDRDSLQAMMFASRRLGQDRFCMLLTHRDAVGEEAPPAELTRGARLIPVPPLDADAVEHVLDGLTVNLDRRARVAVAKAAQGNPLALMELSGESLLGSSPSGDEPSVMSRIERAYARRASILSPQAQEFLCLASTDDTGDVLMLGAVARSWGLEPEVVEEAAHAGLISVHSSGLRFTHPLVRSGIYNSSTLRLRERSHLALADALHVRDPDGALWHRATATPPPDEELANALAQLAERARDRGARVQAARAFRRAAYFTTRPELCEAWLIDGAEAAWSGGDVSLTKQLLADERLQAPSGAVGGRVGYLRGRVESQTGDVRVGYEILVRTAESQAATDAPFAAAVLADALRAASLAGDFARVVDAGTRAEALISRSGDLPQACLAAGAAAMLRQDFPKGARLLSETITGLEGSDDPADLVSAAVAAAYLGRVSVCRDLARAAVTRCRESAAVGSLTTALEMLAIIELGVSPQRAAECAVEGLELAKDTEQVPHQAVHLSILATVDAVRGDRDAAEARARAVADLAQQHSLAFAHARALAALGLLELGLGRAEQALLHLDRLLTENVHPAVVFSTLPDYVEAACRAGERDKARVGLERLEALGQATGATAAVRGLLDRTRALLAPPDEAERLLARAVAELTGADSPFELARTRLLLGEHLRRRRQRAQARPHLRAASELFEELQADPWAARASTELRATGESVSRSGEALPRLTPQEHQISTLVAAGGTSKEVAAQLFISPRTVDYHLRKVFVKLGISSRRELMRFDLDEDDDVPSHNG